MFLSCAVGGMISAVLMSNLFFDEALKVFLILIIQSRNSVSTHSTMMIRCLATQLSNGLSPVSETGFYPQLVLIPPTVLNIVEKNLDSNLIDYILFCQKTKNLTRALMISITTKITNYWYTISRDICTRFARYIFVLYRLKLDNKSHLLNTKI